MGKSAYYGNKYQRLSAENKTEKHKTTYVFIHTNKHAPTNKRFLTMWL